MKITVSNLKKIIREVTLSPAVFKNNKPHEDPLDDQNVANALQSLERAFKEDALMNMMLLNSDKYNAQTREFDDATYEQIKNAAEEASEQVAAGVSNVVKKNWQSAHQKTKKH